MVFINPKIKEYFETATNSQQREELLVEQLELLKILNNTTDLIALKNDPHVCNCITIDPHCFEHRVRLERYDENCRIKSSIQSYDFRETN